MDEDGTISMTAAAALSPMDDCGFVKDGCGSVVNIINRSDSLNEDDGSKTIKVVNGVSMNGISDNHRHNSAVVGSCRVVQNGSGGGDVTTNGGTVTGENYSNTSSGQPQSGWPAHSPDAHKYVSIVDINSTVDVGSNGDQVDFVRSSGDNPNALSSGFSSSGYETDPNVSIVDVRPPEPKAAAPTNNGCDHQDDDDDDYEDAEDFEDADASGDVIVGDESMENGTTEEEEEEEETSSCTERSSFREKLKRTRSGSSDYWKSEEMDDTCIVEFLDKSTDGAEARLAAKRQARAEAREIRMRELERQQREAEENSDKVYDIYSTPDALNRSSRVAASVASPRSSSVLSAGGNNSYHSSRRSSEDSLEEATSLRDMRHELKEVEDKFRKAMIANAQLDNEKAAAAYQVELFKDRLEELDEQHSQLQREHREKCRQFEALKRATTKLQEDLEFTKAQLEERDRLIEEQGLVIVGGEYSSSEEDNSDTDQKKAAKPPKRALVSVQVAEVLEKVGEGSLDVRLKKFLEHRNELLDELNRVKLELEEERARGRGHRSATLNGPSDDLEDIQREANKLLGDYKFKLQKAEQDVSTLQANVARLESQVVRYKTAAETAEKVEDDLKVEKRKLQRELREAQARVEELETAHSHLQKRLDKLKNAKSALLKDL